MLKVFCVRTGLNPYKKVKKISWPQMIKNVEKSTFHTFSQKTQHYQRFPILDLGFFEVVPPPAPASGRKIYMLNFPMKISK